MKSVVSSGITLLLVSIIAGAQEPTPVPIREEVVVTANRTETRIGDTPASVVKLSRVEITATAAPLADDALRQSVGFSIFRRSTSRSANPTTQGVSLRGVGASGASRSIVLFDGVPLNDPFGGWVQWNRVNPVALDSIEVLRGGASSLYGDASLSGAVNFIPRAQKNKRFFSIDVFGGSQDTLSGSALAGFMAHGWTGTADASSFQTKGYRPVDAVVRGPVDVFAGTRSNSFAARIKRDVGGHASLFFRPTYFGEVRTNGTGLQTNRTHIRQAIIGGDLGELHKVKIDWRVYGGTQVFDQVFSAVNAARTSESLNRLQRVPVQNGGLSVQVSSVYKQQTVVGGFEMHVVRGESDEIAVTNNIATSTVNAGGRQLEIGAFVQDFAKIGKKLVVAGSVRFDRWSNYRAFSTTRTLATGQTVTTPFSDRDESSVSPQVSILYHATDLFSLYAGAGRSFRSPTLNEFYRNFRVGSVLTLANERLLAEHANNVEGGITYGKNRHMIRLNGFWTAIDNPVANVTLTTTPSLITRQRQNAGSTRSRGFEIEGETAFDQVTFSAGYLFADSTVTKFPTNPALVGLLVPQVARHQLTFQIRYSPAKWTFSMQGRASGHQFDDDLNQFRLEPYVQVDVFAGRRIGENTQVYFAVENVFNSRYSVGKTPIRTVSSPTIARIGIRWK